MIKKIKIFSSILLVLVFLAPTMVKLGHHHDHFTCKTPDLNHFHEQHEKCAICKFEFSVFSNDIKEIALQEDKPCDKFSNTYHSLNLTYQPHYSFLLRAPPVFES
jgi:hypothetical protein